jgi:hypothetical protein
VYVECIGADLLCCAAFAVYVEGVVDTATSRVHASDSSFPGGSPDRWGLLSPSAFSTVPQTLKYIAVLEQSLAQVRARCKELSGAAQSIGSTTTMIVKPSPSAKGGACVVSVDGAHRISTDSPHSSAAIAISWTVKSPTAAASPHSPHPLLLQVGPRGASFVKTPSENVNVGTSK